LIRLRHRPNTWAPPILLVCVLTWAGCQEAPAPPSVTAERNTDTLPEQQFYDYRLIESKAGVKQWILESDEMQKFSGQEDVRLITVKMDFYQDGEHFSTLTADSGRANMHSRDVHTWGNVIVVTDDGRRLETEELFFNNETQLIHNDVFDRLTTLDNDIVTGIGLEATPDLNYIEIKQEVEAEVTDSTASESDSR